jgi:hypothetical protein
VVDYIGKNTLNLDGMSFLCFEGIPAYSVLLREIDRLSMNELAKRVVGIMV